jgi:hypothetical protein
MPKAFACRDLCQSLRNGATKPSSKS